MEETLRSRANTSPATKLPKLKTGFTFKPDGRAGYIYYRDGIRVLALDIEMSGVPEYDVILPALSEWMWAQPDRSPVSSEEAAAIMESLRTQLKRWRIRSNLWT